MQLRRLAPRRGVAPLPIAALRRPSPGAGAVLASLLLLPLAGSTPATADEDSERPERELNVVAQIRVRPEFRDNADFNDATSDRLKYFGQRTRIGLDAKVNPKLEGRVLIQDTRYWGLDEGASTTTTATERQATDLFEGYVDLRWIWDLPLDIRLGRQRLNFGRQRLVGELDFSNSARTFDAYKFHFSMGTIALDIFSAKLVDTNAPADTTLYYSDRDRNFSGLYATREGDRVEKADFYWLRDIDKTRAAIPGETKRHTVGGRARVLLPEHFAIEGEYAYQTGERGDTLDISAQMLTAEVSYTRSDLNELTLVGGFDWATGDNDPNDSKLKTFNQLFPTAHAFLGFIDYVGRQNIQDTRGLASARLYKGLSGAVHYHWFQLDQAQDAWYNAAGQVNQRDVRDFDIDPGRTERGLGSEIDLLFRFAGIVPDAGIEVGYSHFFPGDFVRTDGGPADGSDWVYLQVKADL